jgi:superoxide dismutase, Cu-Zn family
MASILVRLVTQREFRRNRLAPALRLGSVLCAAGAAASIVFVSAIAQAQVPAVGATADVRDASGRTIATGEFREGRGEVLITILFPNPPILSGTHAVHIMEVGRCDPPQYTSAGNIYNPLQKKHGRQNPDGPMIGDLPNVNFTTGLTSYNTSAPGATLAAGPTSLFGPNRTALVIHQGEDDQLTDPDGRSGARLACGVINPGPAAPASAQQAPAAPAAPVPAPAVNQPTIPSPVPAQPGQPQVQPPVAQPPVAQPPAGQLPPAQVKPSPSPFVVPPPAVQKPAASPVPPVAAAPQNPAVQNPALQNPAVQNPAQNPAQQNPAFQNPAPVAVAQPTPFPVAAAPAQSGGIGAVPALIIAILGVALVGVGWMLRRRSQLQRKL